MEVSLALVQQEDLAIAEDDLPEVPVGLPLQLLEDLHVEVGRWLQALKWFLCESIWSTIGYLLN